MLQVSLDLTNEKFREVLRQEIRSALADVEKRIATANQLPPLLSRTEMMKLLRISDTKATELLRRPDFPVCREAGVLIPTNLLFRWIEKNTGWLESNSGYVGRAI
ncbi:DNA-binding protein [Paenibacillus apiarius]|uniref:DNA-binding protein n=1 Tax=Paenibacillus apiarius TaxID=46240 RepID=UPI003B39FB06